MKKAFTLIAVLLMLNISTAHAQIIIHTESAFAANYGVLEDSVDVEQDGVYDLKLFHGSVFPDDAAFGVLYHQNNYRFGGLVDSGFNSLSILDTMRRVAMNYIGICSWGDGPWQPNNGFKYVQFARINGVNDTTFGWLKLNFTGIAVGGCDDTLACVEVAYCTIPNIHLLAGMTAFPCGQVTGVTYTDLNTTTAAVSWNNSGAGGYEYVIDQSSNAPAGSGTATTDTFVTVPGLVQGTVYYAHVRANCGGQYSPWVTIAFTAPAPCSIIPAIQVTGVTSSTASFQWPTSSSNSVEYTIDQLAADPVAGGTTLPGNAVTITWLDCNTSYYFHLRRICMADTSAWVETQVHTDTCSMLGVPTLVNNATNIFPNPASSELTITADNSEYNSCVIINMVGSTVLSVPLTQATTHADIHQLVPGLYYVALHGKNGVKVMRFVKM